MEKMKSITNIMENIMKSGVWRYHDNSLIIHFGITGDIPIVGNWDNMGVSTTSDVGVFRNSSGYWYRDYSDYGIVYATSPNPLGTTGDTPIIGKWV